MNQAPESNDAFSGAAVCQAIESTRYDAGANIG